MNQKETTPLFPIDPNSSLLDGISVDEVFKDKQKVWQETRRGARKPENAPNHTDLPKDNKNGLNQK